MHTVLYCIEAKALRPHLTYYLLSNTQVLLLTSLNKNLLIHTICRVNVVFNLSGFSKVSIETKIL